MAEVERLYTELKGYAEEIKGIAEEIEEIASEVSREMARDRRVEREIVVHAVRKVAAPVKDLGQGLQKLHEELRKLNFSGVFWQLYDVGYCLRGTEAEEEKLWEIIERYLAVPERAAVKKKAETVFDLVGDVKSRTSDAVWTVSEISEKVTVPYGRA